MMSRTAVVCCSLFLSVSLSAQMQWRRVDNATPGAIAGEQVVADSTRGVVVLFGGQALPAQTPYHLQLWDGIQWTTPTASGPLPSGRVGHTLAFDRSRGKVVMFGGVCVGACGPAAVLLDDTWEYDGAWTSVATVHRPAARHGAASAFDDGRAATVLVGGVDANGVRCAETFEYDGTDWLLQSPHQQPPADGPMAFDAGRQRCILVTNGQTWSWDGSEWTQSATAAPQFASALAFDRARQRLVLYSPSYTEAYEWDGASWIQRQVPAPLPDVSLAMAYDDARRQTLWITTRDFGTPTFRDTWVYEPVVAAAIASFGASCTSAASQPELRSVEQMLPWIGTSFAVEVANIDASSPGALLVLGHPIAPAVELAMFGWPGCFQYVDVDQFETMAVASGTASLSIVIPADQALLGAPFGLQSVVFDTVAAGGAVTTNALVGVIGGR